MRLAVIETAPKGGLLHYATELGSALGAQGHDVELITARDHELDLAIPQLRVRALLPAAPGYGKEAPTGLTLIARRARTATVVVGAWLRIVGAVARGRYDAALIIDDLNLSPAALGALALTAIPRGPRVGAICHEPRPRSRRGGRLYLRSPSLLAVLRALYPRLDAVFVHGERSRAEFESTWPRSNVVVIRHGSYSSAIEDPPPASDEQRILFFGEWRRAKGIRELMEAFDLLRRDQPAARLTLAGVPTADSEPERIRAWAASHDGAVEVIDSYVPQSELRSLFGAARVVAAPYLAGSQSGVVHLAMSMARAVVCSDVGELPETVIDGKTGLVVPAGDVQALRNSLTELLNDARLANRLGAAGYQRAVTEFAWPAVAERVTQAFEPAGPSP
jgi:glycosyltransferase involved in cell wall biosynthesis